MGRITKMMSAYKDLVFIVVAVSAAIAASFGAAALVDLLFALGTIVYAVAVVLSGVLIGVSVVLAIIIYLRMIDGGGA